MLSGLLFEYKHTQINSFGWGRERERERERVRGGERGLFFCYSLVVILLFLLLPPLPLGKCCVFIVTLPVSSNKLFCLKLIFALTQLHK